MDPTPLSPETELAIRRQVDVEMTRYGTEALAYRAHLETVFRNIIYGLGIIGAFAAIFFTYFFGKTQSEINTYARAAVEDRVLDYTVKEELRQALFKRVEHETQSPDVRAAIQKQLTTLATSAVAESAKSTFAALSREQRRQDIARTLPVGSVISYWGGFRPVWV